MINGGGGKNRYLMGIQCALAMEDVPGSPKYAFLSQECRAEGVFALTSTGPLSGSKPRMRRWWQRVNRQFYDPNTIFVRPAYEFVVLHTWDGTHAFRTGVHVGKPAGSKPTPVYPSTLNVEYVTPNYLSFDEVYEKVTSGTMRPKDLFMHVSWSGLSLYCRCNYINYPNCELLPGIQYLQPISGQVCYYENDRFFIAYVACSVQSDGIQRVEFCVRDAFNVIDVAIGSKKLAPLFPVLRWFTPVWIHEYARPVSVDGTCRFYTYS